MASAPAIVCGQCSWPVSGEFLVASSRVHCLSCGQEIRIAAFPAIDRAHRAVQAELLTGEGEASCFYHPEKRASIPCDECGRFLCPLCDLEIDERHLCPVCFQSGVSSRKLERVEPRRTLYDSIALALATWPALFFFWPSIFSAPAALWVAVRRWNAPSSILPRTRIRFYLAILFATVELVLVVAFFWAVLRSSLPPGNPL